MPKEGEGEVEGEGSFLPFPVGPLAKEGEEEYTEGIKRKGGRKKKALKREERAFLVPFRHTTTPSPNRQNGKGDSSSSTSSSSSHRTHDYPKRPAAKKGIRCVTVL